MPVMIGGVVAALVVAAGAGLALAGGNDGPQPTTPNFPTALPTQAVVVPTPGPVVSLQPVPTANSVNPTPGPAAPTPNTGGGQRVSVDYLAVTLPDGWEVYQQSRSYIDLFVPAGGELWLESWHADPATTAEELLGAEMAAMVSDHPDVKFCVPEGDFTLPNGPTGVKMGVCYTAQTSTGATYQATDFLAFAVSDGGTIGYFFNIYAPDENYAAVLEDVVDIWPSIEWKLFTGD